MPPAKKSTKKPPEPKGPDVKEPTASETEAESRRLVAQEILDAGYAIVEAGEDSKGHWFLAEREDKSTKIYVKGVKS